MRLIPGKTKVGVELFKGFSLTDLVVYLVGAVMAVLFLTSSLPGRVYIAIGIGILTGTLGVRLDKEPLYLYVFHILRHYACYRRYKRTETDELLTHPEPEEPQEAEPEDEEKGKKGGKKGKKQKKAKAEKAPKETAEQKAERLKKEAEKKAEKKAKEAKRKAEDKLLKSKKTPPEEKERILNERREASRAAAREMAIYKDKTAVRTAMNRITAFTDIHDDLIDYDGKYYGAAIEIPPVEFRFFSSYRRTNAIENGVGRIMRAMRSNLGINIVKIERPVDYEEYLKNENKKIDELRTAYENGFFTEAELQSRIEVLYDRIKDLRELCYEEKVIEPFYYIVLFDSDRHQLNTQVHNAMDNLISGEMHPKRLNTKELAVFLKYTNQIDFEESDIDKIKPEQYAKWAMPEIVDFSPRTVAVNHIVTHNFCVTNYPNLVGDAWLAGVMSLPSTKVVVKCAPMDRAKSMRAIDHSLQELRGQYRATGIDSKRMELQTHIDTLSKLLNMLQGENEALVECNVYVTAYDLDRTRSNVNLVQPPLSSRRRISEMKKTVKRTYQEANIRLNHMEFDQLQAYIAGQVSGYDPLHGQGRGIPSNSIAACFPWIYATVSDKNGIKLGASDGVPVFIDFFRRDSERVNSNMVIVGKSGSGKSYATKSLLTNLAADNSKIYILDPENEYTELAQNLHGKFINVANAQFGRLNPFHIITALDDDEGENEEEGKGKKEASSSYATHLQFLEEFFRQILPECDKDAMEYLNSMIDRVYTNKGITEETDLSKLKPTDYPIFDDLYDTILEEFQSTDNEYIRTMLRTLMNYVSKFSSGGRNATIWNGPSSITTEENFTVFNFQSLLANRNGTIANAQMLLVLKYIDNEIIKNREYNNKYHAKRKIVVVIDEAHVFIDTKFPVALDFMFQLAKRIRKYNGMQIVITQNIKDFVGSEEIARKSTAIINACQYSFIFSLAPNDMDDLCKLYEKAGGINESEQEQIVQAGRGQAFTVMSPTSRSSFKVEVPDGVRDLFENRDHVSGYFNGEEGKKSWDEFLGESRDKRFSAHPTAFTEEEEENDQRKSSIIFEEITEEQYRKELKSAEEEAWSREEQEAWERQKRSMREQRRKEEERRKRSFSDEDISDLLLDIPDIPDDPDEFLRRQEQAAKAAAAGAAAAAPNLDFGMPNNAAAPAVAIPAASSVMQPIVVQAPTAAPAASPGVDKMVSELSRMVDNLSRLSYESIVGSLRDSLGTAAPKPAADADLFSTSDFPDFDSISTESEESGGVSLGSIFNEDAMAEAARLDREEQQSSVADDDFFSSLLSGLSDDSGSEDPLSESGEEPEEASSDLMDMLFSSIDTTNESSVIDMMEVYGDTIIGISLQELADHIVRHKSEI